MSADEAPAPSRRERLRQILSWRNRPFRTVVKVGLIAPLLVLVFGALFVTVSNQPRFCISCHYMKPFYDAWKTSSHNDVPCVSCHIPPGAKNWLQHKVAASLQVVKYVTRQYGIKPWTEVDDESCLRGGCHETRLLSGKVQFGGVSFDHAPHLTSFRRVTRLRCTSCHAQIVQGTHISVTESSCFLCHFKHGEDEPEMGACQTCHAEIKPHRRTDISAEAWVEHADEPETDVPKYDHEEVLARQVDCRECHRDVVRGVGEVPRDRCLMCHTEPERLEKYDDPEFMHRWHVTDRKVDCLRCHIEIQHGLPPKHETAQTNCQSCHPAEHDAARQLYQGQGGRGAEAIANPMFTARVPCEGCHLSTEPAGGGRDTTRATAAGCMLCHGEEYGQYLAQWQAEGAAWTRWAQGALARARQEIAGAGRAAPSARALEVASTNVALVVSGRYIHNPDYSKRLLRAARNEANRALEAAGVTYRWPAEPKVRAGSEQACATCHTDAVRQQGYAFGSVFDHQDHVGAAQLACETCHAAGRQPQSSGHGALTIGRAQCQSCHERSRLASPHESDWEVVHGGQAKHDPATCATCHSQGTCDSCHGTRIPHAAGWVRQHGDAGRRPQTCAKCHGTTFCASCHQSARPRDHGADWARRHAGPARRDRQRCARCHEPVDCQSCHGLTLPHPRAFRAAHGDPARRAPAQCARCHTRAECSTCHAKRPPADHGSAQWGARHGPQGEQNRALCGLCHGTNACRECHGVDLPHPASWTLEDHGAVAARRPELCNRCHEPAYCRQCHDEATPGG